LATLGGHPGPDALRHGNLLASKAPKAAGQMMNLATSNPISLNDLVEKLNAILGTDIQAIYGEERTGDIKHSNAGIDKAGELLGYEPVVNFDEGLRRTLEWYRAQI
jgi:UDP-glucose 4-epimerase